jgi:two-component system cell cycle sensor histidine kinase PleC
MRAGQHLLEDHQRHPRPIPHSRPAKRELREELTSLTEITHEACSLLDLKARQKGITVKEVFEDNLPRIVLDEQAMRQVALNLVSNALKFTPSAAR